MGSIRTASAAVARGSGGRTSAVAGHFEDCFGGIGKNLKKLFKKCGGNVFVSTKSLLEERKKRTNQDGGGHASLL